jgi:2-phosphosulfolactate phosphatase
MSATGIALRCSGTFWPDSSRSPTTRIDPQSAICSKPKARCDPPELGDDTSMNIMRSAARPQHRGVEIVHATGIEGARNARGVVVVIDVLRSFTVSAYALAGGARECLLVPTVDEALRLARRIPDAIVCAEENALPIPGIAISNSPTQVKDAQVQGKTLIQRSSAGTPVIQAVTSGDGMFAGSLVVASATAQACMSRRPSTITLVASADFPEDHACALYIEAVLRGASIKLDPLLQALRSSERYRKVMAGEWPGFPPTDIELSLEVDRFDFTMPATRHEGFIALRAV